MPEPRVAPVTEMVAAAEPATTVVTEAPAVPVEPVEVSEREPQA